jgi:hypothetical protein
MSENTPEEPAEDSDFDSDSDSENQDSMSRVLVHAFVLGALAVVVAAIASTPSDPGSFLPLDGLLGRALWIMLGVYAVISSIGVICWNRSWGTLFGTHVAAAVLAYPASIPVFMLLFG